MLENRAFDHYLGWMHAKNPQINGLSGNESNPVSPADPSKGSQRVLPGSNYSSWDPNHSVSGTRQQIFGVTAEPAPGALPARMDGFVANAIASGGTGPDVMQAFEPEQVPVLSTLAQEFVLFDRFFAAIPGPTMPNRMMFHSATSHGLCDDSVTNLVEGLPQQTLYDTFDNASITWSHYFEEIPDVLALDRMRSIDNLEKLHWMGDFATHVAAGNLTQFTFINPAFAGLPGCPASDQHPAHDVREGEKLVKQIYETLRASDLWNTSALIVTYDEHGGFYDGAATPLEGVPSPDGIRCSNGEDFGFDRLGVRIPLIVASPWVAKGAVEHGPPVASKPVATSQYDLTSVGATVRAHFGAGAPGRNLTRRDGWAATFEHVWSQRTSPRTDCPMTLPSPPQDASAHSVGLFPGDRPQDGSAPATDLHKTLYELAGDLHDDVRGAVADDATTEAQASMFIRSQVARLLGWDARSRPEHPLHGTRFQSS